jgi:Mrp family chromosome partitioning ATPase/WD40 repeat protein
MSQSAQLEDREKVPPAPPPSSGWVCTFYSYKGGVGRSMALANVAALLSRAGKRVLVIDWDLEAPGIEKYFETTPDHRRFLSQRRKTTPGVVDLVTAFASGKRIDWKQHLLTTEPFAGKPPIAILTAGQDDAGYAARLRAINWDQLFAEQDLGDYLEQMRDEWIEAYDFILIDSRTGITDIGGICTIHLPDVVVAMFTANEQSLLGTKQVIERVLAAREELAVSRFRLRVVPLPSRDESLTEHEQAKAWRERFEAELDGIYRSWLPPKVKTREVVETLKLPYKPYWSFGERLPAVQEGTRDPASLGHAYQLVARLVESRLDWPYAIGEGAQAAAAEQMATEASNRADVFERKSRRIATIASAAVVSLLALVGFGIFQYRRHATQDRGDRVEQILQAAIASEDPTEAALLLAELVDAEEPPNGAARARTLLSRRVPQMVWRRGEAPIHSAFLSRDDRTVMIVSSSKDVDLYDVDPAPGADRSGNAPTGQRRQHRKLAAPTEISSAMFTPDGRTVIAATRDSRAVVWDVDDPIPNAVSDPVRDLLALSWNGQLVAAQGSNAVQLIRVGDGEPAAVLENLPAVDADFSFDNRYLFVQTKDDVVRVQVPAQRAKKGRRADGERVRFTWSHRGPVDKTVFSNDGSLFLAQSKREIAVWGVDDDAPEKVVRPAMVLTDDDLDRAQLPRTVAITAADAEPGVIVFGLSDGTVAVASHRERPWGGSPEVEVEVIGKHSAMVGDIELDVSLFAPRGHREPTQVVTASADGTIGIWKLGAAHLGFGSTNVDDVVGGATTNVDDRTPRKDRRAARPPSDRAPVKSIPRVRRELAPPVAFKTAGEPAISVRFDARGKRVLAASDKAVYLWTVEAPTVPTEWSDLVRFARTISSVCLGTEQRVRLLHEPPDLAQANFTACETAHGRGEAQPDPAAAAQTAAK